MIRHFLWAAVLAVTLLAVRAERVVQFATPGSVNLPALSQFKFSASNDFALELWVKPANAGNELGAIFTSDNWTDLVGGGTNGAWGLYWQSGGFQVALHPSASPTSPSSPGGFTIPIAGSTTGVWHHIVVNFKRTLNMTLYVDGVQKAMIDNLPSWAFFQRTFDSTNAYRLGLDPSGANGFKGSIDEVRLWNRTKTTVEISNAFQTRNALGGNEPGLVAYYQFNEGVGSAICQGLVAQTGNAALNQATRADDSTLTLAAPVPSATDYCFAFNGVNQSIETKIAGDKLAGNELSIEYWFKGQNPVSAVRIQSATYWIVTSWGSVAQAQHFFNINGTGLLTGVTGGKNVADGLWHHIAVTWRSGSPNGYTAYFDGATTGLGAATPNVPIPNIPATLWLGSLNGTSEFLKGSLDEVRIWNRVLPADEIKEHFTTPRRLLGGDPGLVAYFTFNDLDPNGTMDQVTKQLALFRNMGPAERQPQDLGILEGAVRSVPNPAAAGLWAGEVHLKNVSEVSTGSTNTAAAGGSFDFNILLHVDAAGAVRLLKDVTIMQFKNASTNLTDLVLVTDDTLLPNFDGVVKRSGKLVGVRYSSAFYNFDGQALAMAGGLGYAFRAAVTNMVPASSPLNPFRHKFHPQHKNPTDLQGQPYDITREIEVILTGGGKSGVAEGRDRLKGTYREIIRGLHKVPLVMDGEISLERVSLVSKLNNK